MSIPFRAKQWSVWLTVAVLFHTIAAFASEPAAVRLPNGHTYDLNKPAQVQGLLADVKKLRQTTDDFLKARKAGRKKLHDQLPDLSLDELKRVLAEPPGKPTSTELRALQEIERLTADLAVNTDFTQRSNDIWSLQETVHALDDLHRPPVPNVDVLWIPFAALTQLYHPIGKGTAPAANLGISNTETDLSRIDPPSSTFWRKPVAIAQAGLIHSLGHTNSPDYSDIIWEYHTPKVTYGGNPGFEVEHDGAELKVKFGEVHSEPFTTRAFFALGYNVEQTDYAPSLKIKYDRRLFREYHLRRNLHVGITLFGFIPLPGVSFQNYHDPFDCIAAAVLKDGTRWSGDELKRRLLRDPKKKHPENDPDNFNPDVEKQLDYLVTHEANVQLQDESTHNLGPWDFGGLGHENLRELRGAALLCAWLGFCDVRFDNTRLKVVTADGHEELRHYFTDLGGGFGEAGGTYSRHADRPDLFPWRFTAPPHRKGNMLIPFHIVNYEPIDDVPAFKAMTTDDARWMGRMIGQLTKQQIESGLKASGYGGADLELLTAKLLSRRDHMIEDLGLSEEFPPLSR